MCDKAVDKYPFVFDFVPDQYKTQEMCYKIVLENVGTVNLVPGC